MSNTKVTPATIVERFLPRYWERMDKHYEGMSPFRISTYAAHRKVFFEDNFQEVLENLLAEQRLLCANYFGSDNIINATSPLEEL